MSLLEDLKWRFATKAYDPQRKVSQQDLNKILDAIALAPTSSGLQQFNVFVIQDQATKLSLAPEALNPECARDCSHILVFTAWDEYTDSRIDKVVNHTTDTKNLERGRMDSYYDNLKLHFKKQTPKEHFEHAARQSYIALGLALAQAAELKIDSTPAEGFSNAHVDTILKLQEKGLKSTVLMYIGYRDSPNDWNSQMPKSRVPKEDLIKEFKL